MATFAEALLKMGIDPTRVDARPNMSSKDYQSYRKAAGRPLKGDVAAGGPSGVAPDWAAPGTAYEDGSVRGPKKWANAIDLGPINPAYTLDDRGTSEAGDDGNIFKKGLMGLLEAVDTGRGYGVSAIKEATDGIYGSFIGEAMDKLAGVSDSERAAALEKQTDASWSDFVEQGKRHIGFREVMDQTSETQGTGSTGKGGLYSVAGFAGDVIADPLTYLTLGTGTAAGKAASGSMRVAVEDGGAKMLSKELASAAEKAGLMESRSVQKLIVESTQRGRGAITERGLARAGVTTAEREALGIPTLARTIGKGGIEIPGSRIVANAAEDFKGGFKSAWRGKPVSAKLREVFTPENEKALMRVITDVSAPVDRRAKAVLAKTTVNQAVGGGRRWGDDVMHYLTNEHAKDFRGLDDVGAADVVHGVESGAVDDVSVRLRNDFAKIREDAIGEGVDVGSLGQDYMPHQTTSDWYKLAESGDADAAEFIKTLDTEQGFRKARALNAGDEFLGETLQTGTIREINEIAVAKKGVKLFEDDIREIIPRYVSQVTESIIQAKQIKLLESVGLSRPLAERTVAHQLAQSPERAAQIAYAKKGLVAARGKELVSLSDGSVLRRDALSEAREAVVAEQSRIAQSLQDIDHELKQVARDRTVAQRKLARSTAKMEAHQAEIDGWTKVVQSERGPARKRALRELKKAEARLDQAKGEITQARKKVTELMGDRNISLPDRVNESRTLVKSESAWRQVRDEQAAQAMELQQKADELLLKRNPPGDGPLISDRRVQIANDRMEMEKVKHAALQSDVDAAVSVFDRTLADATWTVDALKDLDTKLDEIVSRATPGKAPRKGMTPAYAQELRDRMAAVSQLLERTGNDPIVDMLAKVEATAALADGAAANARFAGDEFEQMIKGLSDPAFMDHVEKFVEPGMRMVGETNQMPEWLFDATKMNATRASMPDMGRFMSRYYNLWKGYAIMRPGFHVRNAYSAMFNMYLEGGAKVWTSIPTFHKFYKLVHEAPENYMELAVAKFGQEEADMLQAAWTAAAASGSGQAAGEFSTSAMHAASMNPMSEDFALLKWNRKGGESIENHVRGAHAYDVLKRGGNLDQAVDTLNKWHFNYVDVSSFDQKAKLVNPFWMFYSRNLALQAQTFMRNLPKLNRTYVNAQRNLAYGEDEDYLVPEYFGDEGAIRLPGKGLGMGGNSVPYLFPDLPAMQFAGQLDQLSHPMDGKLLSNTAPWLKLPMEAVANKQFFSGVPFKNQPTQAGGLGQLLGMIPGSPLTDTGANGQTMIDDKTQYMLNNLLPMAGQFDRLIPSTEAGSERQPYTALSFLTGLGVRENNDRTRKGEEYRLLLAQQDEAARQKALGF